MPSAAKKCRVPRGSAASSVDRMARLIVAGEDRPEIVV